MITENEARAIIALHRKVSRLKDMKDRLRDVQTRHAKLTTELQGAQARVAALENEVAADLGALRG